MSKVVRRIIPDTRNNELAVAEISDDTRRSPAGERIEGFDLHSKTAEACLHQILTIVA